MKICEGENCHKPFEPIKPDHKFCPECWDKMYRKMYPEKFKQHRVCQGPGCKKIIDAQPDHFNFCVDCWIKQKNAKK